MKDRRTAGTYPLGIQNVSSSEMGTKLNLRGNKSEQNETLPFSESAIISCFKAL